MLVYGAGADPIWSEPESAPGPPTSGAGAAKKNVGSATLQKTENKNMYIYNEKLPNIFKSFVFHLPKNGADPKKSAPAQILNRLRLQPKPSAPTSSGSATLPLMP